MNIIVGIKAVVISNFYNFTCEDMVSKPTVVDLEQGSLLGGLAHWAVNPSNSLYNILNNRIKALQQQASITY